MYIFEFIDICFFLGWGVGEEEVDEEELIVSFSYDEGTAPVMLQVLVTDGLSQETATIFDCRLLGSVPHGYGEARFQIHHDPACASVFWGT